VATEMVIKHENRVGRRPRGRRSDWDVEQLAESLLEAVQDDDFDAPENGPPGIVPQGAPENPHG
jgi:hypothetical protein